MINRDKYLNRLISKKDNGLIKIITGIRRSGKSYLLFNIYYQWLLNHDVDEKNIITIRLDNDDSIDLRKVPALSAYIRSKIKLEKKYYILIDEIQLVDEFEDLLNGLNNLGNVDIYVTGSNSRLLSSDINTKFRGRGDQVKIFPLSFLEYLSYSDKNKEDAFLDYMYFGGMPQLSTLKGEENKTAYLKDLFESTYIKDIKERYTIKNEIALSSIIDVLCSNIGSLTSMTKLENTIKSLGYENISNDTIGKFIGYLTDAFLFEKVQRYDIKGKKYLQRIEKYYCCDVGLRNARLNYRQQEPTHILENIVYIELLSRGYNVDVGINEIQVNKLTKEIDFVARKSDRQYYIQVAYMLPDQEKINQEIGSFKGIDDGFKKIVITYDKSPFKTIGDGYPRINVIDFLLDDHIFDTL